MSSVTLCHAWSEGFLNMCSFIQMCGVWAAILGWQPMYIIVLHVCHSTSPLCGSFRFSLDSFGNATSFHQIRSQVKMPSIAIIILQSTFLFLSEDLTCLWTVCTGHPLCAATLASARVNRPAVALRVAHLLHLSSNGVPSNWAL